VDIILEVAKALSAEADPNTPENEDFYARLWATYFSKNMKSGSS